MTVDQATLVNTLSRVVPQLVDEALRTQSPTTMATIFTRLEKIERRLTALETTPKATLPLTLTMTDGGQTVATVVLTNPVVPEDETEMTRTGTTDAATTTTSRMTTKDGAEASPANPNQHPLLDRALLPLRRQASRLARRPHQQ